MIRPFFAFIALAAATLTASAGGLPHIVILYADDMGYGDLGIQNPDSKIPTPHLDQLAREGMRFTDGHSSSGICTPSRYALLTGRYHWRDFHSIVGPWGDSVFQASQLTLPEMLKERGYATACIGKWHLGWNWKALEKPGAEEITVGRVKTYAPDALDWSRRIPNGPLEHGFDYYFGDDVPNFPPYAWIENDRIVEAPSLPLTETPETAEGSWEARPGPMAKGWRMDAVMPRLTERVVSWIDGRRGQGQPFFLFFPWTSPHAPIVPAEEFAGSSQAGGYGDYMFQSDWSAGQVLDALDRNGFTNNTLVLFMSDNGPERYAFERTRDSGHRSMGKLRGVKRDIWEGGHRTPFVVRWPGVVKPGSVSDALVGQIDIMATLASVVGYELSGEQATDSLDLLGVWKGEGRKSGPRGHLVHNTNANHYAIREGNWVLVTAKTGSISKPPEWFDPANGYPENPHEAGLYDLSSDLGQRNNLLERHPEKAEALRALLNRVQAEGDRVGRLTP